MKQSLIELKNIMFLQQYLKNAKKNNQVIYAQLLEKKLNGENLSFDYITRYQLAELYLNENVYEKQIAFLFEIERETVQQKRLKWGIVKTGAMAI